MNLTAAQIKLLAPLVRRREKLQDELDEVTNKIKLILSNTPTTDDEMPRQ